MGRQSDLAWPFIHSYNGLIIKSHSFAVVASGDTGLSTALLPVYWKKEYILTLLYCSEFYD